MIYNGFEYNKYGVCINPEIPYEYGVRINADYFQIEVSETAGGWIYGWSWSTSSSGGGNPCSPNHKNVCPSRSDAIVVAATEIRREFSGRGRIKTVAELDRIISEECKPKVSQMTIFDML